MMSAGERPPLGFLHLPRVRGDGLAVRSVVVYVSVRYQCSPILACQWLSASIENDQNGR